MPNLRAMLDGTTITAGAPKQIRPSPVAQHVSETVQDPFGKTKEGFSNLTQKKLEYEVAKDEMTRQLAPVQSILDHVGQVHDLGTGQPGNTDNPDVDEEGNAIDPAQNGMKQGTTEQMNQQRPSLVGHKPGVSSGPQQSVRPAKLGMPKPGGGKAQNSPQPKGSGNSSGNKKPQSKGGKTGREVNVKVSASAAQGVGLILGASNRLSTQLGLGTLKCGTSIKATGMPMKPGSSSRPMMRSVLSDKAKVHKKGCMCANCSKMDATGRSKGAKKGWSTRGKGHLSKTEKAAHYANMD